MSNERYLYNWKEGLCITLDSGNNCDFNRLLFLHCPPTKYLQNGTQAKTANRNGYIAQLKNCFVESLSEGGSQPALLDIFFKVRHYLEWVDKQEIKAFTKQSLVSYFEHQYRRILRGEVKNTTYNQVRTKLISAFKLLDLPEKWFEDIPTLPKYDTEPFEAYSSSDLKQLLPILRGLFKQTSQQFLINPEKHMKAHQTQLTMEFHWKGEIYPLYGAISKMMAAATYLLAFYTYANTSMLLNLVRPKITSISTQNKWYTMPAFKRRAFKVIHVEMGEHSLDIPKYAMDFFDTLLKVSEIIDSSNNALLFQTYVRNKVSPVSRGLLQDAYTKWLRKHFPLTDERGRELRPIISRFRETGSQLTSHYGGDIAQGIVLDNTPLVRRKHYSTGNRLNNQSMMQEVVHIRQEQAVSKSSAKAAQRTLNIDVLTIDESQRITLPNLSRTANGCSCAEPFGDKSEKYRKKTKQHRLTQGEKLACAELLACFGCEHQVIVQSVSDIWCLLSFKECIEESLFLHLDAHHYDKNFNHVVGFIEETIIPRLNKKVVKQAESKLNNVGRHPLWIEAESVISLANLMGES